MTGKASLTNTADADILEFILGKLTARIAAKARTFLVKVKAHRGEPLHEGADDLAEEGRLLAKEGEGYRSSNVMYNFGVGPRFAYVSASARAPK